MRFFLIDPVESTAEDAEYAEEHCNSELETHYELRDSSH
jgi:hypothetical protein